MKNILIINCFLMFLTLNLIGQEKYTSYYNDFSKKTYDIEILYDDSSNYILFINMFSLDLKNQIGGIFINKFEHQSFLDTLKKVSVKYEEWINVGKKNKVDFFVKKINIKYQTCGYFLIKDNWQIDDVIYIKFIFKIIDGKKYLLSLATNNMIASDDETITHEGFVLVFSSPNDIDYFINILSIKKVESYLSSPKINDLFKD